jgi:hypothetical protein
MSNTIFPNLPGITWNVLKSPRWSTKVLQSVGGKEMRAQFFTTPLYTWQLTYELLRANALLELQSLIGFFNARQGKFDSFLFSDPSDNNVTAHGFGVGDGATTAFQLQRSNAGPRTLDFQCVQPFFSTPRTNQCTWSERGDQWTPRGSGFVTSDVAIAPDGNPTADFFNPGGAAGYVGVALPNSNAFGRTFAVSIWLRSMGGPKTVTFGLLKEGDGGVGVAQAFVLTPQWQRYSLIRTATGTSTILSFYMQEGDGNAVGWYFWGADVKQSNFITPYIKSPGAGPVTALPAYWPASGDAFEPVFDLNGAPSIFRQDWQGNRQLFPYPRTNSVIWASDATNAAWVKTHVTPAKNAIGPDGVTNSASTLTSDGTAGANARIAGAAAVAGSTQTISGYVKSVATGGWCAVGDGNDAVWHRIWINLSTGAIGTTENVTSASVALLPNGWLLWTITYVLTNAITPVLYALLSNADGNLNSTNGDILAVFGFQHEPNAAVAGPTILTAGATVTVTDYTLSAVGVVTFAVAPLASAILTWTGSYYWRVRFDLDQADFNNFLTQFWEAKKITLVSVKAA